MQRGAGSAFPWGTLLINVTGSLAIGFLAVWLQARAASAEAQAFLIVGVLGGYTTFSAFSWETLVLAQGGALLRAALYAGGSVLLGVLAAACGMAVARSIGR